MGASRTLLRKLDLDLIARIEASGRPEQPKKQTSKKTPRPFFTYRQNGRGHATSFDPWARAVKVKVRSFTGAISLNRSRKWKRVASYAAAREMALTALPRLRNA